MLPTLFPSPLLGHNDPTLPLYETEQLGKSPSSIIGLEASQEANTSQALVWFVIPVTEEPPYTVCVCPLPGARGHAASAGSHM